jgi:hypothetical protein
LLDVAARQWPFALCSDVPPACATPLFSVIVPVAGRDRIPQFEAVLKGLFAQSLRQFEVIIVEHSSAPEYAAHCPRGVRCPQGRLKPESRGPTRLASPA